MFKRILVPVDGSDTSALALDAAIDLALTCRGRLRVVHALDEPLWLAAYGMYGRTAAGLHEAMCNGADELLHKNMDKARAAGIETDMMLFDKPGLRLGEAVATAAKLWDADLVVVGSHGRKGFHRLVMGSGAEQVIRQAPVPVLVIRGSAPSLAKVSKALP
ncbi:universal stress protein [Hydrogenophaga sp.]|uniref:universal stress protein n=1 Tax=Hydrogenophaga sp. TaxID=1904254 RepID=UPI003F720878